MTSQLQESGKKISAKFSVLGLNLSNNGSVCIMRDGKIAFYLESERITRKKRDYAIRSLLKYVHDIDAIALCDSYWTKDSKKLISSLDLSIIKNNFPVDIFYSENNDYSYSFQWTNIFLSIDSVPEKGKLFLSYSKLFFKELSDFSQFLEKNNCGSAASLEPPL